MSRARSSRQNAIQGSRVHPRLAQPPPVALPPERTPAREHRGNCVAQWYRDPGVSRVHAVASASIRQRHDCIGGGRWGVTKHGPGRRRAREPWGGAEAGEALVSGNADAWLGPSPWHSIPATRNRLQLVPALTRSYRPRAAPLQGEAHLSADTMRCGSRPAADGCRWSTPLSAARTGRIRRLGLASCPPRLPRR